MLPAWWCLLSSLLFVDLPRAPALDAFFSQVHPQFAIRGKFQRSPGRRRAVVLVHGFRPHPIDGEKANTARLHTWQQPGSVLVSTLGRTADIYAFAYSQNHSVEKLSRSEELILGLHTLRAQGYEEIVLVGHSAGGVVVRLLVEDHPNLPLTKVIQIAAPNSGAGIAQAHLAVRSSQLPFLQSLSKCHRCQQSSRTIPETIQFVSIICNGLGLGDGVVHVTSQWPEDLQRQGIPAEVWFSSHPAAVRLERHAKKLQEIIERDHPRWSPSERLTFKKKLVFNGLGKLHLPF